MSGLYKPIDVTIRGISPLMMHNGQLADPLNSYAKAINEISTKRGKTDADHERLAELEWEGSLYLDDKRRVVVPGEVIEGMMGKSAGRLKAKVKAGVICDGSWPLQYDGPKDVEKLKADLRFRDRRGAKLNGKSTVMRTRPIFVPWSLAFVLHYLPTSLNESQVLAIMKGAGLNNGMCDYRPKYGRFEVVEFAGEKLAKAG